MRISLRKSNGKLAEMIRCLRLGLPRSVAAKAAGLNEGTAVVWVKQGLEYAEKLDLGLDEVDLGQAWDKECSRPKSDPDYSRERHLALFGLMCQLAEAKSETELLEHVVAVGQGGAVIEEKTDQHGNVSRKLTPPSAQPAQWILSRRWRQRWGDKIDIDLESATKPEAKMDLSKLDKNELIAFREMLNRVRAADDGESEPS